MFANSHAVKGFSAVDGRLALHQEGIVGPLGLIKQIRQGWSSETLSSIVLHLRE